MMEEEEPTSSRREWKRPTLEELLLNIEAEKSRKTPERRTVTYEHIGGVGHKSQKSDSMRDCEKQPKYRIPKRKVSPKQHHMHMFPIWLRQEMNVNRILKTAIKTGNTYPLERILKRREAKTENDRKRFEKTDRRYRRRTIDEAESDYKNRNSKLEHCYNHS